MNYTESATFLFEKKIEPTVGIVLGTGLHKLLNYVDIEQTIAYTDIPNFPVSTVEFHKGNLIYESIKKQKVLIMQGRFMCMKVILFSRLCFRYV